MIGPFTTAPSPTYRLIPSRFPPIGLLDTVATAADASAAMELAEWTNDRRVKERLDRLPHHQWVYGRPNSSVIMASFLHVAPSGMRFNNAELGAWYASPDIRTSIAEVAHHLRRDGLATGSPVMTRTYRTYSANLQGNTYRNLVGIENAHPNLFDAANYNAAQQFGESVRADGHCGIIFNSIRRSNAENIVSFVPPNILDVTQTDHFEISLESKGRDIQVRRLTA